MLALERPLAVFDLETTGTDFSGGDRIVQIGLVLMAPGNPPQKWVSLVNPLRGIPKEATEIHGITDQDVTEAPTFVQLAPQLEASLKNCDLCGYNIIQFDLPFLEVEFSRTPIQFSREGRKIVDPFRIFQINVPHSLAGALKFYCNQDHEKAHDALADVEATIEVLEAQIKHHELPDTVAELAAACIPDSWATGCGRLRYNKEKSVVFNFGKYHGYTLQQIALTKPDYMNWIISANFSLEVKRHCQEALDGVLHLPHPQS